MIRRLVLLCATVIATSAGGPAHAQTPFPAKLVPTETTLERVGLHRHWFGVVPLVETERLMKITLTGDMMFAQTNYAMVHAFDAESGRLIWSAQLGERTGFARGVTANSFAAFVTNANLLMALDKKTGRRIWQYNLGTIPTSTPACDENRVMVGLTSGKLMTMNLKKTDAKGNVSILTEPRVAWARHTGGPILTRPLPASEFTVFGSTDGKADVVESVNGNPLFRVTTGGPIGEGLGGLETRYLLIPSADNNLYCADLFAATVLWSFASGAPIEQEPMVADQEVYTVNTAGYITLLDQKTGEPRWTRATQGGRLASVSATRIYLRSYNLDLFVMDRKTGRTLVNPGETLLRAGVNLRDFDLDIVNRFNDRLYFATSSGMIVCLRETANLRPRLLKDPKAPPFGYVPPEGIKPPTPAPTAAEPGAAPKGEAGAAAPEDAPAAGDKKEKEKEQEEDKEKPAAQTPKE